MKEEVYDISQITVSSLEQVLRDYVQSLVKEETVQVKISSMNYKSDDSGLKTVSFSAQISDREICSNW